MKNTPPLKRKLLTIGLVFLCSCAMPHCFGGPPTVPEYSKDIARIGTTTLKEDKLRNHFLLELTSFPVELQKEVMGQPIYSHEKLRPTLLRCLDQWIQDELILQYGTEKNLLLSHEEMAIKLQEQKNAYSNKEIELILKEKNMSLSFWKQNLERQIQINHILYTLLKDSLNVSTQDIRNYYNKNRSEFAVPDQVRARHIVTDSIDKANDLRQRIVKGDNFAKLALEHSLSPDRSQGGDLGYFSKGQFPEVFDHCFTMDVGQLSPVLKSDYGFHIFKLLDKSPNHVLRLEEVTEQIYQKLFAEKQKIQYQKWIEDRKQKVKIEILEENLKAMLL